MKPARMSRGARIATRAEGDYIARHYNAREPQPCTHFLPEHFTPNVCRNCSTEKHEHIPVYESLIAVLEAEVQRGNGDVSGAMLDLLIEQIARQKRELERLKS